MVKGQNGYGSFSGEGIGGRKSNGLHTSWSQKNGKYGKARVGQGVPAERTLAPTPLHSKLTWSVGPPCSWQVKEG